MSRRRYLSTDISLDGKVNRLAMSGGDFAALLYTWMVPHARDDATLHGTPEEIMFLVMPGRRDKTERDITEALDSMEEIGLVTWDREAHVVSFPPEPFYRYQTYIQDKNRRLTDAPAPYNEDQRGSAENAGDQREIPVPAENAASHSHSHSHSVSPSPSPSPSRNDHSGEGGAGETVVRDKPKRLRAHERFLGSLSEAVVEDVREIASILKVDIAKERVCQRIAKRLQAQPQTNGVLMAMDYMSWQAEEQGSGKKSAQVHGDRILGWDRQMARKANWPQYLRVSAPPPSDNVRPLRPGVGNYDGRDRYRHLETTAKYRPLTADEQHELEELAREIAV